MIVKLRKGSFPAPVTGESPAQSVEGGRTLGEGQHAVSVAVKQQEHLLVVQDLLVSQLQLILPAAALRARSSA